MPFKRLYAALHRRLPGTLPAPTSLPIQYATQFAPYLSVLAILLLTPLVSPPPPKRTDIIKPADERLLIIGASSGCGEDLAKRYAARGANVCIVARTKENLERVADACRALQPNGSDGVNKVLSYAGDISNPDDMIAVRDLIVKEWKGLDTLHIMSGYPSTQTLLEAAHVDQVPLISRSKASTSNGRHHKFKSNGAEKGVVVDTESTLPGREGLHTLGEQTRRLAEVNVVGIAVSIATFLPLLSSTSESPLIHHLSSVAALIPAPTLALYAATKAGGLACFLECGSREWRRTKRTICPGTIDTEFNRKSESAVKGDVPAKRFGKALLSVDDVTDAIIHHSSYTSEPRPLRMRLFSKFLSGSLALQVPLIELPPNDTVFLPANPYRFGYWALDTPFRVITERMARKTYGLE
ncbi:hypothetical protein QFC20_004750 [Naganishia adeliensis]|uniref:Uncharacterized protein n=1 Tax=Naganishia adeliensis TaxID=92952 RepID=A0ACC2VWY8_9TREE|nr:hypothetical protein QFC20_004750 [Naganishia adeliensis]